MFKFDIKMREVERASGTRDWTGRYVDVTGTVTAIGAGTAKIVLDGRAAPAYIHREDMSFASWLIAVQNTGPVTLKIRRAAL